MNQNRAPVLALLAVIAGTWLTAGAQPFESEAPGAGEARLGRRPDSIALPEPRIRGGVSVEEAIFERRSTRRFRPEPLTLEEASQLLWAAMGKTVDGVSGPTRAHPSAGATHPLEAYLVAGNVRGLPAGVYRYNWRDHSLTQLVNRDVRAALANAAMRQTMIRDAPASIVFSAVVGRATARYGPRGEARYVPMDAGAAFQNVHLQAQALGLGTVIVGAFFDDAVRGVMNLGTEVPLGIMPVGRM
ncbi:MAG TPA: SagB/ThcOx family dehydrogenase [Magnetospirillaceae bacterium]|nr:SagB/ThcOx family dehydrogenase [Magnetospirillaceae bacterium]